MGKNNLQQMDAAPCEEKARLRLIAEGYEGLYEVLTDLKGLTLAQRYVLKSLYAVGGQGILCLANDLAQPERPVLVRMALLPYHRPAYIKEADIRRTRQRIEREARLLQRFDGAPFPRLYDLIYSHNPLQPSERGPEITETEPYLAMELIQGTTLAELTRALHRPPRPQWRTVEAVAVITARVVADLCVTLHEGGTGYLYTDLNPNNLAVLTEREPYTLRVLDVGSVIPVAPTSEMGIPFSWAYVPPEYYRAYDANSWHWPTTAFVAYTLGKTLWQLLTNRQPMPGEHPDLDQLDLFPYSSSLGRFIRELIGGWHQDFISLQTAARQLTPALAE